MNSENRKNAGPKLVVFAWNYREWGGAQMYFLGIARRIRNRCAVRFLFPEGTGRQFLDFLDAEGFEYGTLPCAADLADAPGVLSKIRRHAAKIRAEKALLRALRPYGGAGTVFHVELSPWQSVTAIAALSRYGPVVSTMHNRLPQVSAVRETIWRAKFAVACRLRRLTMFPSNRDAKKSLEPFVTQEFLDRTPVTYTNVDPDEVAAAVAEPVGPDALKRRFGLRSTAFLVLTVGQFIDRKGRWEAVGAARKLRDAGRDVCFVWVTNSELTDSERRRAAEAGDAFVVLRSDEIGPRHLDLMRFLRIADCFALPSRVEGLPISLLEAMSLGIPSISTNVNAIPEAVVDGETGILIRPGDPDALADAVLSLMDDRERAAALGAAGRRKVLAEFTETAVAEIAYDAYARALGEKS